MTIEATDLRPAPHAVETGTALRELHAQLDALLAAGPSPRPPGLAAPAPAHAAMLFRHRLAVRGWVLPSTLSEGMEESERETALRSVGPEVELAERTRPGQWFMTLTARKRVFASAGIDRLEEACRRLHPGDDKDPVRRAIIIALAAARAWTKGGAETIRRMLDGLPLDVLQALSRSASWGGSVPGLEALAAIAGAEHKRRRRDQEVFNLAGTPILGREEQQSRLQAFLARPQKSDWVSVLYVSGVGGSGKSTLLVDAEQKLRSTGTALVVRLDFDSPYLDPLSPEQLDIQFLNALAIDDPDLAVGVQPIIAALQNLADHRTRMRLRSGARRLESSSSQTVFHIRPKVRGPRRSIKNLVLGNDFEESVLSLHSERLSALQPLAELPALLQRRVALFLDTVENVTRLGAPAIESVLQWINSLWTCLPGHALRVVVAGRDKLGWSEPSSLAVRLEAHNLELAPGDDVVVADLDVVSAQALLIALGMPKSDAALASQALPRNPLVLRLAAEAHRAAKGDLLDIQQAYRDGRVDRTTAAGYLAQRVIQHVPGQPARRYVVAAMALDEVNERLLRDVVIPVVDGRPGLGDRQLARRVYQGLQRASWLTLEERPGRLRWHSELRGLALPMIAADPAHAAVAARVQATAKALRAARRAEKSTSTELLGPFEVLIASSAFPVDRLALGTLANTAAADAGDETAHRLRLEGVGGMAGEGDRLVDQGRALHALDMYRQRPTRERGSPPTFVLRAASLTGDWVGDNIATVRILAELRRSLHLRGGTLPPDAFERLHWLTRLELLRAPHLERAHVELLRDVCRGLRFRARDGAFLGLVAIAEGLQSSALDGRAGAPALSLIAPVAWPPPRSEVGHELRFIAFRTAHGLLPKHARSGPWVTTTLGAMVVVDDRWVDHVQQLLDIKAVVPLGTEISTDALRKQMASMRLATLAQVEQFVARCRDTRVRIDLSRISQELAGWLLRGTLVEPHGPLATLLSKAMAAGVDRFVDDAHHLNTLLAFVDGLALPSSAILTLGEFRSTQRRQAQSSLLESAVSAVLLALDRAHVLSDFCSALIRQPAALLGPADGIGPGLQLLDLAARCLAWEQALDPHAAHRRQTVREGLA